MLKNLFIRNTNTSNINHLLIDNFRCPTYNYGKSTRNDNFIYDWLEQLITRIHLTITKIIQHKHVLPDVN